MEVASNLQKFRHYPKIRRQRYNQSFRLLTILKLFQGVRMVLVDDLYAFLYIFAAKKCIQDLRRQLFDDLDSPLLIFANLGSRF